MRPINNDIGLTNKAFNTIEKYGVERCFIVREMAKQASAKNISTELQLKQKEIIRMIDAVNEYKNLFKFPYLVNI